MVVNTLKYHREMASWMALPSAWPRCRDPVTLGGGRHITNLSTSRDDSLPCNTKQSQKRLQLHWLIFCDNVVLFYHYMLHLIVPSNCVIGNFTLSKINLYIFLWLYSNCVWNHCSITILFWEVGNASKEFPFQWLYINAQLLSHCHHFP